MITENSTYDNVKIDGYEYQSAEGKTIGFNSCPAAEKYDETLIAEYELFRYRLLVNSCHALKKYLMAKSSNKGYFPAKFGSDFINNFPATSAPLLYKAQKNNVQAKH